MIEFIQNNLGQRDITNIIIKLTKGGSDRIHNVILTKYQKYTFYTILKNANILDKVNKYPYGRLLNVTPCYIYSIPIHVLKTTLADISKKQKEKIPIFRQKGG